MSAARCIYDTEIWTLTDKKLHTKFSMRVCGQWEDMKDWIGNVDTREELDVFFYSNERLCEYRNKWKTQVGKTQANRIPRNLTAY